MIKVLMVCLGNICRSPMAHGILEEKAKKRNKQLIVDSAGTANFHIGEMPDERAIKKMRNYNIDISKQKARQFHKNDFETFDYIFVMDTSNYENIIRMAKSEIHKQKVDLILNILYPQQNMSVPDPYYGGDSGFENVYQLLDAACEKFIEKIK
ncbi:MAG: low molecular weight phosphotyrosine protein phosphatase [Bacteroidetes bacterium]|nr:low molecular weight phosphotyrosine protein phosphatase [Bacteroidota bacterium]MCL4816249.1 low molecular weight phosphotyrosine protein phosphatase [Flavobacteriales bacterium]NOG95132.1 low molecular weight phosphotyrosine protein phosphatase [Bacteroidota bacterium]WKZ74517.1 MAG: low molecular weight protein-tyrosine-phosphatase [Vicingaceae bacterium]